MEQQGIPMLGNQNGFQGLLTFFAPSEDALTEIGLRDSASNAEF